MSRLGHPPPVGRFSKGRPDVVIIDDRRRRDKTLVCLVGEEGLHDGRSMVGRCHAHSCE